MLNNSELLRPSPPNSSNRYIIFSPIILSQFFLIFRSLSDSAFSSVSVFLLLYLYLVMEPWNCLSDGKGTCFDNEKDPFRSRNSIFGTDQKTPNNLVNDGLMSEFVDIGLPDAMRKPFSNYPGNADGDSSVKVASSCLIASSWSSGMKECFPEPSNSLVGSNVEGEVSISDPDFGKDRSVITSLNPSPQAKKSRLIGSCSQSLLCQVHGCNIDLSSSKDYHKRHRVCEAHSKTARVIVNGIEQRFCQQCSRFHLLAEFDDGKRSCRRRLAGHNERRRKPPFHFLSSKQQKLHHSYKGSKFFEMCSGGFSFEDRYEQSKNCRIIKFEDKSICSPQPSIAFLKGHSRQKPSFSHRALSLLSAQPQDFAHQVTATPYVRFNQAARVHQNMGWNFKNGLDVAARSDSNMVDLCRSEVFNVKTDMYVEDSTLRNPTATNHLGNPPTVNLIQLSSHLQRVEQQKTSVQVKHETADPCYFLGT